MNPSNTSTLHTCHAQTSTINYTFTTDLHSHTFNLNKGPTWDTKSEGVNSERLTRVATAWAAWASFTRPESQTSLHNCSMSEQLDVPPSDISAVCLRGGGGGDDLVERTVSTVVWRKQSLLSQRQSFISWFEQDSGFVVGQKKETLASAPSGSVWCYDYYLPLTGTN